MRIVGYVLVVLILGTTTASVIWDGWRDVFEAETMLQWVVGVAVVVYGLAGMVTLLSIWQKWPWITWAAATWGSACIIAGGIAPVAYGAANWAVAPVSAAATALVVVPLVYFLHRQHVSRKAG